MVSVQNSGIISELRTLTEEALERLKIIRRERLGIKERLKGAGYWVDKRYIPKGTKLYGPYYCLRWRGPDGKIHAKYLGKDPAIALPDSHSEKLVKALEKLDKRLKGESRNRLKDSRRERRDR